MNRKKQAIGCASVLVAAVVVLVGLAQLGDWLEGEPAPCERFAEKVTYALSNCHSGQTKNQSHYVQICEQRLDPSDACLQHIESLTCDAIDPDVIAAASAACLR